MKNRKNSKEGKTNYEKEEYFDFKENSIPLFEENSDSQEEIYDYKNILPCYYNLLDNYDILQYKDIQIPRLSLNNELHFNKYKKPFDEYFKKISIDYILTSNFISILSKIAKNELKSKKKSEKYNKASNKNEKNKKIFQMKRKKKKMIKKLKKKINY